jgi:hypothetical protein
VRIGDNIVMQVLIVGGVALATASDLIDRGLSRNQSLVSGRYSPEKWERGSVRNNASQRVGYKLGVVLSLAVASPAPPYIKTIRAAGLPAVNVAELETQAS